MATKSIKNIQTTLPGEGIGSLVVTWDMEIEYDIPASRHEDDTCSFPEETRAVEKIRSVEFQVYDKVGIDITKTVLGNRTLTGKLEDDLLSAVEFQSREELIGVDGVDMVRFAGSLMGF